MPDYKEKKRAIALNMDDAIPDLKPGEVTDALNMRLGNSTSINSAGIPETLQGEIGLLLEVASEHIYYGGAIGGAFVYSGFEEVTIGAQTWMKRNWDENFPGSKAYNDNEDNADVYGRLYNHSQVVDADFAPTGWRVPTEADFDELLTFLGGALIAGGKLKEYAENHWITPNTGGTDEVGFKALPGGRADVNAVFDLLQLNGFFWLLDEGEPLVPEDLAISGILYNGATATWTKTATATGYKLDVAEDAAFTVFVAGFNDLDVGDVDTYGITGLIADTPYYIRIRGYNEIGDGENCDAETFTTLEAVVDGDGNSYAYVTIGAQQWLIENLKTTKYIDGTPIPNLTVQADWVADINGAYCWYNNDKASHEIPYGALYNYYAAINAHGIAPSGWRVPSIADFNALIAYLGSEAGGILKEVGTAHWLTPNTGAIDMYGFAAVGAGGRSNEIGFTFHSLKYVCVLLTSTSTIGGVYCDCVTFGNTISDLQPSTLGYKKSGWSIRCMRDIP